MQNIMYIFMNVTSKSSRNIMFKKTTVLCHGMQNLVCFHAPVVITGLGGVGWFVPRFPSK